MRYKFPVRVCRFAIATRKRAWPSLNALRASVTVFWRVYNFEYAGLPALITHRRQPQALRRQLSRLIQ